MTRLLAHIANADDRVIERITISFTLLGVLASLVAIAGVLMR